MTKKAGLFIVTLMLALALPFSAALAQQKAPEAAGDASTSEIQKTIDLLEDDAKRAEVLRLLKLMAVMEQETAAAGDGAAPRPVVDADDTDGAPGKWDLKRYFQYKAGQAWRMVGVSGIGLRQSLITFTNVMKALAEPQNFEIWRPYLLKAFLWGLFCLVAVWALFKKFGAPPKAGPDLKSRAGAALRYILLPVTPSILLCLSFLTLPTLSTTAPGVTADLATGFEFLHSLAQHFFINMALLFVFLRLAAVLLRPDDDGGRSLVNLNPALARPILHTVSVVSAYMAVFIVIKGVVLEHFVVGALYSLSLVLMTIPVPIYLTGRIIRLGRLINAVNDTGGYARHEGAPSPPPTEAALEYRADVFIHRYWPAILIAIVWLLEIMAVLNPADAVERFVARLAGTALIVFLAALTILIERRLMLKLVRRDAGNSRGLLLSTDTAANILVWPGALVLLVSLWGMPLDSILANPFTREIVGRAFAIVVIVASLVVFLKFSRLATNWLMSSKELYASRNMRTMLPLMLTVVRTLAIFIAVVVILERLGVNVGPILAGAGILSLGVGMGAQTLVKDVINGISILLMNTLSIGDYVTMGGQSGTVEFLGLRTARLRDINGNLIIVPNSSVTDIVNMTRDFSQEVVELSVPSEADLDAMLKMAREAADELYGDPEWRPLMTTPIEVLGISAIDSNSSTIRLRVNALAGSQWMVGRELRLRLRRRTRAESIKSQWFRYNVFLHQPDEDNQPPADAPAQSDGNEKS